MFKVKLADGTFASFNSYDTAIAVSARLSGKHGVASSYAKRIRNDKWMPVGSIVWDHTQAI